MKTRAGIVVFLFMVMGMTLAGCSGMKVALHRYNPAFSGDYEIYRGKPVYLMNFNNHSKDTGIWEFYSPDMKFTYSSNDLVSNYFWYSFREAFTKLGMIVSDEDKPDHSAKGMWVTLLSISDEKFHVLLTVQEKEKTIMKKEYSVQEPPPAEKERDPASLEQRVYKMTNRLIGAILDDSEFRKLLTKSSSVPTLPEMKYPKPLSL
jgi:hypothetical protein